MIGCGSCKSRQGRARGLARQPEASGPTPQEAVTAYLEREREYERERERERDLEYEPDDLEDLELEREEERPLLLDLLRDREGPLQEETGELELVPPSSPQAGPPPPLQVLGSPQG